MIKIPRIKFGLIVTLFICVLMVVFRQQVAGAMTAMVIMMSGEAQFCPPARAIGSIAHTGSLAQRAIEIRENMRLIERDPAGYELYEGGSQRIWMPAGSFGGITLDMAEQESRIYDYDRMGPKPGDVVIDAGANVGLFAIEALKQGAAKVVAIEPAPRNLECLSRNLKNEILTGKVMIYPKGVWDREDILEMYLDPTNEPGDSFVLNRHGNTVGMRLPLTTVDNIVNELHLEKVDFIKMDIEGAERRALAGAKATIHRFRPRMAVCVYHLWDDPVVIPALIGSIRPDYRQKCGPCLCLEGRIWPQVYFYN